MERLTEKIGNTNCVKGCGSNCKYGFQHCRTEDWENCKTIDDVIDKLAEYEDLEEQDLLLRLPCKVGDTVYFIYHNEVHHEEVKRFFQCNGGKNWGIVLWGMYPDLYFDQIGKTVFLTKEEAEQKLKEMESD